MVLKSVRPSPRPSKSHTPLSHSHRSSSKPSTTPMSPPARIAVSVGQQFPPSTPLLRTQLAGDRSQSPNYFGLVVNTGSEGGRDTGGVPKEWSPPTSSILSFGADSPKHLPIDSNPDFEAFKRQTESNHTFNLGHGNLSHFASTPGPMSLPPGLDQKRNRAEEAEPSQRRMPMDENNPDAMDVGGRRDSAYESSTSKRTSNASSLNAVSFFDIPRQQSPANMISPVAEPRNTLSHLDERHHRLSLPLNKADPPSPHLKLLNRVPQGRSDTLPSTLEDGPTMIAVAQLKDMLDRLPSSQFLLLDLRVFPQFGHSRIRNALNLCIPTTLLKRPSFNLHKLQETFTNAAERERFAQWPSAKHIVVYDSHSSDKKDATAAVNTLKKFTKEGWQGICYILKGGFTEFSRNYPNLVDHQSRTSHETQSSKINLSLGTSMPDVAPVAGGCMIPFTKNAANPFFSNIRQNQDLVGGVGQMSVKIPEELTHEFASHSHVLPNWLLEAAASEDQGKKVSEKFLSLELAEQSRMTKALSHGVSYGTPAPNSKDVQIAGVEKGGKNRYNNIWPFEHARVRLQGKPEGSCDYVNASHIKASQSNKQYIASQGPLPATFEDFWSVIWDQDVRVIVMLTAEKEGGQLKCHSYWSQRDCGAYRLKPLSEKKVSLDPKQHRTPAERRDSGRRRAMTAAEAAPPSPVEQPHVIVRKFSLSHTAYPFLPMREITQVHYSSWPDFGAPANASQLLSLVELSNQMQRAASSATQSPRSTDPEDGENTRPMLVHCSAGCGRTGTFCTVDSVIDMLKRQRKEARSGVTPMDFVTSSGHGDYMSKGKQAGEVDGSWIFDQDLDLVQRTVEDFRGQRLSMVQSLRQFVLCYETVLEWMAQQYGRHHQRSGSHAGVIEHSV